MFDAFFIKLYGRTEVELFVLLTLLLVVFLSNMGEILPLLTISSIGFLFVFYTFDDVSIGGNKLLLFFFSVTGFPLLILKLLVRFIMKS